jgi:hypothetical protein
MLHPEAVAGQEQGKVPAVEVREVLRRAEGVPPPAEEPRPPACRIRRVDHDNAPRDEEPLHLGEHSRGIGNVFDHVKERYRVER